MYINPEILYRAAVIQLNQDAETREAHCRELIEARKEIETLKLDLVLKVNDMEGHARFTDCAERTLTKSLKRVKRLEKRYPWLDKNLCS